MLSVFFLFGALVSTTLAACPAKPTVAGAYPCKMKQATNAAGITVEYATYCCSLGGTLSGNADITCTNGKWTQPSFTCTGGSNGGYKPVQPQPAPQPGPQPQPIKPSNPSGGSTDGFSYQQGGEIWMPSKGDQTVCGMSKSYPPYSVPKHGNQCTGGITGPPSRCKPDVAKELYPLSMGEVVDRHNCWRSKVNPPAKNMPKLKWDDELAIVAERWAAQCPTGHDSFEDRALPHRGWRSVGQNLCGASYNRTFTDCIDDWAAEQVNYKYGVGSVNGRVTGHYTQLISDASMYVGCGSAYCPQSSGYWKFVQICNYGAGGNYNGGEKIPYTKA